tara:strand:- start:1468 stop:2022 length:555 start_codon:yes stop_codon:yes gene_type:complete
MQWLEFLFSLQAVFFSSILLLCCIGILYFLTVAIRKSRLSYSEIALTIEQTERPADSGAGKANDFLSAQVRRINVSFYFSLVFALIGLLIIMFSLLAPDAGNWNAHMPYLAGALMVEAMAIAFFLNSLKAQRHISEVIQAERSQRISLEITNLLAQITDSDRRDQLISQLILRRAPGPSSPRAY